jgi:tetrapyrrole methylase family protein/MazG family protein
MIDGILAQAAQRHGLDAEAGVQLLGLESVGRRAFDPSWPLLILPGGGHQGPASGSAGAGSGGSGTFEPAVLPGRAGHGSTPLDVLRALYPPSHPVLGLDGAPDTVLSALDPDELSRAPHLLPALGPLANLASPHGLPWIAARLRAPDGCPWDREQDHHTLRPFLLEEAYEAYDALEHGATAELAGELGDLLLQIVLHAQVAAEAGLFDLDDVYREIGAKIVRRHPHVFADAEAATANDVLQNWERIKAGERAARGGDPRASASLPAAFAGLARSLPALAYSQEMQGRAAALGYDWPDVEGVIDKLGEEAVELLEARTDAERAEEFGDLLLVLVNLARKLGVDAESALRDGNAKFARRFASVERLAAERGRTLDRMTFEELDELWDLAKAEERAGARGEEET